MASYCSGTTAQPQPGDLLEITNNFSKQWALYLCDGYVLIAVPLDKMSQATPCKKSFIKMQLLQEAVGSGTFEVNNKYDSEFPALHYEKIIHKAQILIDTEVSTDLLGTDGEQFVILLRYGDNISIQI
ncbi:phospholipase A and acyltransferase 1-like isoform 2-T2 [Leptodactylus fuscus]|uniref:phospholipase A and acyltransferase 1-like isoform X2 n=1 Tax=Leptodactylus fuscus TaxID=238119 RepID=UPI003F4EDE15